MKKIYLAIFLLLFQINSYASEIPAILNDEDFALYTEIFELQSENRFDEADIKIKDLDDKILLPIVMYERFTSPKYKSKSDELKNWMNENYNNPGATDIYKLALKKTPKKQHKQIKKVETPKTLTANPTEWALSERLITKTYSKSIRKKISSYQSAMRRGKTKVCRNILDNNEFKKSVSKSDYARMSGRLAFLYYVDANFELANKYGEIGANGDSEYGLWTMGLLNYKNGKYDKASEYFVKMSELEHLNDARKIEALFWAGRAEQNNGNYNTADAYFRLASKKPQLFYGALASASLGEVPEYKFYESEIDADKLEQLMRNSRAVKALALIQLNRKDWAEKYLSYLITEEISPELLESVHTIADSIDLPRISIQTSKILTDKGILDIDSDTIMSALYPTPDWEPMDGWKLDRCLLFAITRQESQFKTNAKSKAGATGLMQLMPGTAKLMCKENNINLKNLDLLSPAHNMFLGQTYVSHLLEKNYIDNNLVKMLISYNAGSGNLLKWEKKFQTEDPLLYVESFPARETRDYIKRVLTNLWLYSAKMNQPMDSLTDMANGNWPKYNPDNADLASNKVKNATL